MPHIRLPEGLPGIQGLLVSFPATAKPLTELAEVLLRGPSTLSSGERELIASFVSRQNGCVFCSQSHGAAAQAHLKGQPGIVQQVWADHRSAPISAKLKALLEIAGKVARDPKSLSESDVAAARAEGASDAGIHDTVLIAAAFCMFNRYVDGLATTAPAEGSPAYEQMGEVLANQGYIRERKPSPGPIGPR